MWKNYSTGCGIPGIPSAPTGRRHFMAVDKDLMKRQLRLADRLPVLTKEEIAKARNPFHAILLHEMMTTGYFEVCQEINHILRKEERERRGRYRLRMGADLITQKAKFAFICQSLQKVYDLKKIGRHEASVLCRKELAETLMKNDQDIWISKYLLQTTLKCCKTMEYNRTRTEAEIHCLLAFLARETNDNLESALSAAIEHLSKCRLMAKEQPWQFKQHVMTIKLKKPIALHGFRIEEGNSYEIVDGRSMTLYMIATLLEHEMLISLANQIMHSHHKYPTEEDVAAAHVYADSALKLALEVRHPVALSSALVRFGLVLRHSGAYESAIGYFRQLQQHCEITGDSTTQAIVFHNIGMCMIGMHQTIEALQYFVRQREIATEHDLPDLEADAMNEIGHLLLQEGHLWEAEECYSIAYAAFINMGDASDSHADASWAMNGIAAGHKMWGRFAGHIRNESLDAISLIYDWKFRRVAIPAVERPDYETDYVADVYKPFTETKKRSSTDTNSSDDLHASKTVTIAEATNAHPERRELHERHESEEYDHLFNHKLSAPEVEFISDGVNVFPEFKAYRRSSVARVEKMSRSLSVAVQEHRSMRGTSMPTFTVSSHVEYKQEGIL